MTRRLVAIGRRDDTARTGTCTHCRQPVTAVQSALDIRTITGRHRLTHLFAHDCRGTVAS